MTTDKAEKLQQQNPSILEKDEGGDEENQMLIH